MVYLLIIIRMVSFNSVAIEPADEMLLMRLQENLRGKPSNSQLLDNVKQVDFREQFVPSIHEKSITSGNTAFKTAEAVAAAATFVL